MVSFFYDLFCTLFLADLALVIMLVFWSTRNVFVFWWAFSVVSDFVATGFLALIMAFRISCNLLSFEASSMSASCCRSSQKVGIWTKYLARRKAVGTLTFDLPITSRRIVELLSWTAFDSEKWFSYYSLMRDWRTIAGVFDLGIGKFFKVEWSLYSKKLL